MYGPRKAGRPTTSPRTYQVRARLDEDSAQILIDFCNKNNVTKSEAIRIAVGRLLEGTKKEWE